MSKQRKLYAELLQKNIRKGRLLWILKQGLNYFGVLASSIFNRPLCGPLVGSILVTYRCNANCKMCDLPKRGSKDLELSTDELKKVIDSFKGLGVSSIGFSGGEPFLREDIFELIRYARTKGLSTQLSTNGFLLNTENITSVFESGLDSINISIDSSLPEIHKEIRGVNGGFQKAIDGIQGLADMGKKKSKDLLITTSGIVSNENLDSYLDLLDLISKIGADCLVVETLETESEPIPKDRLNKLDTLVDRLIELKSTEGIVENSSAYLNMFKEIYRGNRVLKKCYASYSFCSVDCFGNVFPCWGWIQQNKSVENIKNSSLREIWHSPQYSKVRKGLKYCNACSFHCHTEMNLLYKWFDALFV